MRAGLVDAVLLAVGGVHWEEKHGLKKRGTASAYGVLLSLSKMLEEFDGRI